jgi:hypothetical protein
MEDSGSSLFFLKCLFLEIMPFSKKSLRLKKKKKALPKFKQTAQMYKIPTNSE